MIRAVARRTIDVALAPVGLLILLRGLIAARLVRRSEQPRLLWGTQPIIALPHLSRALRERSYDSAVVATDLYPIFGREMFDYVLLATSRNPVIAHVQHSMSVFRFLAEALGRYDVFHYYFDSGLLRRTALEGLEYPLIKASGAKLVLFPYGSDAFVYDTIPDLTWRGALMIEYASLGDGAAALQSRIRRGTRYADCVVGCLVHVVNLPRWDILPLTCYPVDTEALTPRPPRTTGRVRIAHAANHRGFKGTDFLIAAVDRLRAEGHDIDLTLIERIPHDEATARIADADIYVDQLNAGYAMAALEGMALGKVVISHIGDTPAYDLFRRYSYLDECPIVHATPETIPDVLRDLIARRAEWPALGAASRSFCERRHSFAASAEMWQAIYARIWDGEDVDLINFYHPNEQARRTPGSRR